MLFFWADWDRPSMAVGRETTEGKHHVGPVVPRAWPFSRWPCSPGWSSLAGSPSTTPSLWGGQGRSAVSAVSLTVVAPHPLLTLLLVPSELSFELEWPWEWKWKRFNRMVWCSNSSSRGWKRSPLLHPYLGFPVCNTQQEKPIWYCVVIKHGVRWE